MLLSRLKGGFCTETSWIVVICVQYASELQLIVSGNPGIPGCLQARLPLGNP